MSASAIRTVAILGATGHIGKTLTASFLETGRFRLRLFARSPQLAEAFLQAQIPSELQADERVTVHPLESLHNDDVDFDAVVNALGPGDPASLRAAGPDLVRLAIDLDEIALRALAVRPDAAYIYLSSGAVYGGDFAEPAAEASSACFPANDLKMSDVYGAAKFAVEARHRSLYDRWIVDLRIFAFHSRFIPRGHASLIGQACDALLNGTELVTGQDDVVRDYAHPDDLFALVEACLASGPMNDVLDVYSASPARKSDLLKALTERLGLRVRSSARPEGASPTGTKPNYYSTNRRAHSRVGFTPRFGTIDGVVAETSALLDTAARDRATTGEI